MSNVHVEELRHEQGRFATVAELIRRRALVHRGGGSSSSSGRRGFVSLPVLLWERVAAAFPEQIVRGEACLLTFGSSGFYNMQHGLCILPFAGPGTTG